MKKCPVCQRLYNDHTLNFCEEDGATLIANTINTAPPVEINSQPIPFAGSPHRKKSNSGLWIIGIIGAILILGVGGVIGVIVLASLAANETYNQVKKDQPDADDSLEKTSNKSGGKATKIDLARWREFKNADGEAKIFGDEYQLTTARKGYFYVMLSSGKFEEQYLTNDAAVRVTVRAVSGTPPTLGYGLVINSDITPLNSDYAFLIYNGNNPSYRVVRHTNKTEEVVKPWTAASQIRTGSQTNQLEVRSKDDKMDFYINGQFVTSINDESDQEQGVVGVYSSDGQTIGFSNLEIVKN